MKLNIEPPSSCIETSYDEDAPLCDLANMDVTRFPVFTKVIEIYKYIRHPTIDRVYFDLKKLYTLEKGNNINSMQLIDIWCVDVNRRETVNSCQILEKIMEENGARRMYLLLMFKIKLKFWILFE